MMIIIEILFLSVNQMSFFEPNAMKNETVA